MSDTVHYKGTLTEVEHSENETLEDVCKRLLDDAELPACCKSYAEFLLEENYLEYIVNKGVLYSVSSRRVTEEEDIFKLSKDKDGVLSFELMYYSGGCSFTEAIDTAFENYEK